MPSPLKSAARTLLPPNEGRCLSITWRVKVSSPLLMNTINSWVPCATRAAISGLPSLLKSPIELLIMPPWLLMMVSRSAPGKTPGGITAGASCHSLAYWGVCQKTVNSLFASPKMPSPKALATISSRPSPFISTVCKSTKRCLPLTSIRARGALPCSNSQSVMEAIPTLVIGKRPCSSTRTPVLVSSISMGSDSTLVWLIRLPVFKSSTTISSHLSKPSRRPPPPTQSSITERPT